MHIRTGAIWLLAAMIIGIVVSITQAQQERKAPLPPEVMFKPVQPVATDMSQRHVEKKARALIKTFGLHVAGLCQSPMCQYKGNKGRGNKKGAARKKRDCQLQWGILGCPAE